MSRLNLWSCLPTEILVSIAKLHDQYEDIVRIRSVCSSWRSSIPPPLHKKKLSLPLMLPLPNPTHSPDCHGYLKLTSATFYRLDSPNIQNRRNWCLVRVQETECGQIQVLNPFGGRVELSRPSFPQVHSINHLAFYKSEITNGYHLSMERGPFANVAESAYNNAYNFRKVIVSSKPVSTADDYLVIALSSKGVLFHIKLGDDKWNIIDRINLHGMSLNFAACDILERDGHFYVVSKKKLIVILDYSLQVIQLIQFPNCGDSHCDLNLVESKWGLFLVHRHWYNYYYRTGKINKPFEIEVYVLDDQRHELLECKDLGDGILFLCHDCCFSIPAQDFQGLKGNCIYSMVDFCCEFANDAICKGLKDCPIGVYNLEDASIGPLLSHPDNSSILWSIPSPDAHQHVFGC